MIWYYLPGIWYAVSGQFNIWDRCPMGLNREVRLNAGAVPPLYWGANPSVRHWDEKSWEGSGERRSRARRTAYLTIAVITHEGWGGDSRRNLCAESFPALLPGFLSDTVVPVSMRAFRSSEGFFYSGLLANIRLPLIYIGRAWAARRSPLIKGAPFLKCFLNIERLPTGVMSLLARDRPAMSRGIVTKE